MYIIVNHRRPATTATSVGGSKPRHSIKQYIAGWNYPDPSTLDLAVQTVVSDPESPQLPAEHVSPRRSRALWLKLQQHVRGTRMWSAARTGGNLMRPKMQSGDTRTAQKYSILMTAETGTRRPSGQGDGVLYALSTEMLSRRSKHVQEHETHLRLKYAQEYVAELIELLLEAEKQLRYGWRTDEKRQFARLQQAETSHYMTASYARRMNGRQVETLKKKRAIEEQIKRGMVDYQNDFGSFEKASQATNAEVIEQVKVEGQGLESEVLARRNEKMEAELQRRNEAETSEARMATYCGSFEQEATGSA